MTELSKWTDDLASSQEELDGLIKGEPLGFLVNDDYRTPYWGLRYARCEGKLSYMALVESFGAAAWIHVGSLMVRPR